MDHKITALNGNFGIMIDGVTRADLADAAFQRDAYDLWTRHGGLLAVRGEDLADIAPDELVAWSDVFGAVENQNLAAREDKMIKGYPILRIGNLKDDTGKRTAQFSQVPALTSDDDIRYNPETAAPSGIPIPLSGRTRRSARSSIAGKHRRRGRNAVR